MERVCKWCDKVKPLDQFVWYGIKQVFRHRCIECERERSRNYYRTHKEAFRERDKLHSHSQKTLARKKLRNAVVQGKITQKPCEQCGDKKSEAHHEDYSKPLEVTWLCRKHHTAIHHQTPHTPPKNISSNETTV